jgi:hypothetical protein
MPTNSVLAALTVKLTRQYENAATEALMYVLRTHAPSSAAISELLRHSGLPDDLPRLAFRTQVYGADGSIPDLVGTDASGVERLIVEAKFWAELTDHQPVSYLRRLSESLSSVLLFVCPEKRVQGLWDVLKSRVRPTVAALGCPGGLPQAVTWLKIPPTGHLAIVSWHALLSTLASDAAAQGDRLYESDIHQLEGLCEQVDSEAFLPLHASELSAQTGRRVSQFADLVDAVLVHIKERISRKDLKGSSPRSGSFGKYFLYSDIGCLLEYSPLDWGRHELSPLWLQVQHAREPKVWLVLPGAADTLRQVAAEMPSRVVERGIHPRLALILPCGVEKDRVVGEIARQVLEACEALRLTLH